MRIVVGFFEQNLAKTISVYVHKSNDLRQLPKASATAVRNRKLKVQLPKVSISVGLNILTLFFFTPKVKYSGLFSWVMSEISYIFVGFMPI